MICCLWEGIDTTSPRWCKYVVVQEWHWVNGSRQNCTPGGKEHRTNPQTVQTLARSPAGFVSCCLDASFIRGSGIGWGMCIVVLLWQLEAHGLPLLFLLRRGKHVVCFKLSSGWPALAMTGCYLSSISRVWSTIFTPLPGADISELGSIIQECSGIISSFPNFNVKFIRRQANSAAHCLARVALSKSSLHIYHCIPDCISQLIISEMQWSCFCQKIIVDILYWNGMNKNI